MITLLPALCFLGSGQPFLTLPQFLRSKLCCGFHTVAQHKSESIFSSYLWHTAFGLLIKALDLYVVLSNLLNLLKGFVCDCKQQLRNFPFLLNYLSQTDIILDSYKICSVFVHPIYRFLSVFRELKASRKLMAYLQYLWFLWRKFANLNGHFKLGILLHLIIIQH